MLGNAVSYKTTMLQLRMCTLKKKISHEGFLLADILQVEKQPLDGSMFFETVFMLCCRVLF